MKRKNIVAFILLLGCVSLLVINPFKKDIWDSSLVLLKNKILSEKEIDDKVDLSTFTPFEWDYVYSFDPYVPKESIYETIGYKWDNISETVSEGMNQIVFMKDGKVVCYLYGYPENNKFAIYFNGTEHTENASILRVEDHAIFDVKKNEDVVYLTHYQ